MTRRQQKVWLVLLLFVHLLVHPVLHEVSLFSSNAQVAQDNGARARNADDCAFCRDGSALSTIVPIALVYWQPVLLQIVPNLTAEYVASFQSIAISPRAPPLY